MPALCCLGTCKRKVGDEAADVGHNVHVPPLIFAHDEGKIDRLHLNDMLVHLCICFQVRTEFTGLAPLAVHQQNHDTMLNYSCKRGSYLHG